MTPLREFQREGVRLIYQFRGRALLADDQGLGKTIQALDWIRRIPKRRPVVIVTPASLKYTWQAEASLHFGMRTEVLEGRRKKRMMVLPGSIVILNYEVLDTWLPCLLKAKPECVILDEIHYCKNLSAKRTKNVIKLAKGAASVLGLSGTPLTNRPIELWSILQIVRPDIYPSREKFAWRFCKPRYTPWGWQYDGAAHLDELNQVLRRECMIRRLKVDVLPELPDKTRRVVAFRLDSLEEYHQAQNDFLRWLRGISPARAHRAARSQALTKVGYLLRLVARLKLDWTERWITEFFESHPGEKLVALTMNTFVIDHLSDRFRQSVIIDGRVIGRRREESVRRFQSNRQVSLLLGNIKAAGLGLTLTAARQAVFLDFPWTPGDLLQGEDRVHRIGQKKNVIIHYLTTLDTIEEKMIRVLRKKATVLDAVLNGETPSKDLDIFDQLLKEIKRGEDNSAPKGNGDG